MADQTPAPRKEEGDIARAAIKPVKIVRAVQHSAQEDSGPLGAEDPRKIVRQGLWIVFIFFGIFGVWSLFGHITAAVVAPGKIKLESERKIVQHLEGGIIEDILVHEGQEVKEGETLVVLRSVNVDANANMHAAKLLASEAKRARLLAEKEQTQEIVWPETIVKLAASMKSADVLDNEDKVFAARKNTLQTQVELLKSQLAQLEAQEGGLRDQVAAEGKIISALREEVGAKRKMLKEHFIDKPQVLTLERELAAHEGTRGRLRQQLAEARQRASELNLRIMDAIGKYVREATEQLAQTENELTLIKEQIRPLADERDRLQITAPVSGQVVDLKIHSRGGVIHSGDTLMDIVPEDQPLIIETRVPVNKITDIYLGQPANITMDAYDYRITPRIPGKLTYISGDSLEDGSGAAYYLCYVEADRQALEDANLEISPGMPATVYITTGEKTVAHYALEPLFKSWQRALTD